MRGQKEVADIPHGFGKGGRGDKLRCKLCCRTIGGSQASHGPVAAMCAKECVVHVRSQWQDTGHHARGQVGHESAA